MKITDPIPRKDLKLHNENLSEEEVKHLLNTKYKNCFPHTKKFLEENFKSKEYVLYPNTIIVKEDIIENYINSRKDAGFIPSYDFSLLPDFIVNKRRDTLTIICHEKICGIEVGEFETTYHELITKGKGDPFKISSFKSYTNPDLIENKEETERIKNIILKNCGDNYGLDNLRYVNSYTPMKIYCNNCKKYFWIRWESMRKFKNGENYCICQRCNVINSAKDKTYPIEILIERSKEKYGDTFDFSLAKPYYKNLFSPIPIICKDCGNIFWQTGYQHLDSKSKYPCPKCRLEIASRNSSYSKEELTEMIINGIGNGYEILSNDYKLVTDYVTILEKCSGKEFTQPINNLRLGKIDTENSSLEYCVKTILNKINVDFHTHEYIKDKIMGAHKKVVIIDFIVFYNNKQFWIECNGQQHYYYKSFLGLSRLEDSNTSREEFQRRLDRDKNVEEFCKKNNYIYVEIPFNINYSKIEKLLRDIILNNIDPNSVIKRPKILIV